MIEKINVQKFGLFENYLWDTSIGRDFKFKKLNIIYGRNYSGKTTLSRIFRCIELHQLHNDYTDCDFSIKLDDNRTITQANFDTFQNKIRVYNTDFIKDNLNWLYDVDGTIKPFTILGATNVEIDKRINEIDEEIGNIDEKKGLEYEKNLKSLEVKAKGNSLKTKKESLASTLTDKARIIKNQAGIYNFPTYQINSIKGDIASIKPNSILDDEILEAHKKLLREEAKNAVNKFNESTPGFSGFFSKAKEVIEKQITPSEPITDLLNDSILQEWVRSGIALHKEKRTSCGFCGNPLPKNLWEQLDAHFNKESEILRKEIKNQTDAITAAKKALIDFVSIKKESLYAAFHADFEELCESWDREVTKYNANLDTLLLKLKERESDIFKSKILEEIADNSNEIYNLLTGLNILIEKNNARTASLSKDQQSVRIALRLNEVARFIRDIDYAKLEKEIDQLQKDYDTEQSELSNLVKKINSLIEEKRKLEADAKDESRGAELVNRHLTHFFGHDELKLVADGESPNMKFKIIRSDAEAKNLSEGECSLISFCYFIAKIEDELKEDANTNQLILYIDDPISSLDNNHIFFMFSLIESLIAKPNKYNQLFIATHNLDFLKYLKKLTIPKERAQPDSRLKNSINHLLIERRSRNLSVLRFAPKYLKDYVTEFNYLFEQMYRCAEDGVEHRDHNYQYNFGNNARKFLESYLYYKYPNHDISNDKRLEMFFNNEMVTISLIRRVINEYSHLEDQFDRALEPIDEDVIKKVAVAIVNKIKEKDVDQYNELVNSITA